MGESNEEIYAVEEESHTGGSRPAECTESVALDEGIGRNADSRLAENTGCSALVAGSRSAECKGNIELEHSENLLEGQSTVVAAEGEGRSPWNCCQAGS